MNHKPKILKIKPREIAVQTNHEKELAILKNFHAELLRIEALIPEEDRFKAGLGDEN